MKQKIFLVSIGMVIAVLMQASAISAPKTFFIKGSGIHRGAATALLTETNNSNYQFFLTRGAGTNPLTLTLPSSATPIADFKVQSGTVWAPGTPPPPSGRNVQADCLTDDTLSVIVWTTGVGAGNYYGRSSLAMTSARFDDSALTWNWDNLAVNWRAVAPWAPAISGFEEATTFDAADTPTGSNVKVYSLAGIGTDLYDQREVTAYRWKMWTGDTEPGTYLSDSIALGISGSGTATLYLAAPAIATGTTYHFKVEYRNVWGDTLSSMASHRVAGSVGPGTGGGITEKTYPLIGAGMGINQFSLPFAPAYRGTNVVGNFSQLVAQVNAVAGSSVVKSVGWWNETLQTDQGYLVSGGTLTPVNGAFDPTDPRAVLEANKAYQITVSADVSITLRSTSTP